MVVIVLMSLVLNSALSTFISDSTQELADRELVYKYFGTFTASVLSMFEVTLGGWAKITRILTESVSEAYLLVFLPYRLIIGFAVIKIIAGVIMHETFKVAANDDELMIMQKSSVIRQHKKKMHELFREVDASGDGRITWPEFHAVIDDVRLQTWLSAMDLDVSDAHVLFELLANGDGAISAEELVTGMKKLKGTARSIDLLTLMRELKELGRQIECIDEGKEPHAFAAEFVHALRGP